MDRKSSSAVVANVVGNGVVIPKLLEILSVPTPIIIGVAAVSIGLVAVWGHSAKDVSWRKRVLPIIIMTVGLLVLTAGAVLYYRQKPLKAEIKRPNPIVAHPKPDDIRPTAATAPKPEGRDRDSLTKARMTSERQLQGGVHSRERPLMSDIRSDIRDKKALIVSIVIDWRNSNDGIPSTEAEILDRATPYINQQLEVRGQKWKFDRDMRKLLGFPPAIGDSYAE